MMLINQFKLRAHSNSKICLRCGHELVWSDDKVRLVHASSGKEQCGRVGQSKRSSSKRLYPRSAPYTPSNHQTLS